MFPLQVEVMAVQGLEEIREDLALVLKLEMQGDTVHLKEMMVELGHLTPTAAAVAEPAQQEVQKLEELEHLKDLFPHLVVVQQLMVVAAVAARNRLRVVQEPMAADLAVVDIMQEAQLQPEDLVAEAEDKMDITEE
jgi:hypothetical protein